MKYPIFLFFILLLMCSACQSTSEPTPNTVCLSGVPSEYAYEPRTPSLCTTDTCASYLAIWKELVQEKNNLDQDFFDNHIELYYSGTKNWARGISFNVCYKIQIDWAITHVCDKFIINIDPDNSHYPLLDLPRNVYLTKADIKLALDNRAFSSSIVKINNATEVLPLSFEEALNELIEFSAVSTLCFNHMALNKEGNLMLKASARYEGEENLCINGEFDLITGDKIVFDDICYL